MLGDTWLCRVWKGLTSSTTLACASLHSPVLLLMSSSVSIGCVNNYCTTCSLFMHLLSDRQVSAYPVVERAGFIWLFFGDLPEDVRPPIPATYVPELEGGNWHAGEMWSLAFRV